MRIGPLRQVGMIVLGMAIGFCLAAGFFAAEGRKIEAELTRAKDELQTWMDLASLRKQENDELARTIEAQTCDAHSH